MVQRNILVEKRRNREWSQKDVVEELKRRFNIFITESYYGMIEQGVRTPKLQLAFAISAVFECGAEDVFFDLIPNKTLDISDVSQNTA